MRIAPREEATKPSRTINPKGYTKCRAPEWAAPEENKKVAKSGLLTRRKGGPMVTIVRERRANDSGGHPGLWHRHRP
jgi:hypothetical protein